MFFFFHFGWLVHGRFVGFVCTGYDRRLDDDLLFYVGFLVFFVSLAIPRVLLLLFSVF